MPDRAELVAEIRRFNRFYTRRIGLLEATLTRSPYTLTEARVLFELGHRTTGAGQPGAPGLRAHLSSALRLDIGPAASEIAEELRLDPAYLTRILRKFGDLGLTEVRPDPADGRRRILSLTDKGSRALAALQAEADREIGELVAGLDDPQADELAATLRRSMQLLGEAAPARDIRLRPHHIGDVGWAIERQARLYAEEHGWNQEYEALACEIGAAFLRNFVPGKEFCWVAERDGVRVGVVFLVRRSDEEAQLRMLHVERAARGSGVGNMLVEKCVGTARSAGYKRIMLWTNDVLAAARRIYERNGFRLVSEEDHHSFGSDLRGQVWELAL